MGIKTKVQSNRPYGTNFVCHQGTGNKLPA